jgi:hypothetical protein
MNGNPLWQIILTWQFILILAIRFIFWQCIYVGHLNDLRLSAINIFSSFMNLAI